MLVASSVDRQPTRGIGYAGPLRTLFPLSPFENVLLGAPFQDHSKRGENDNAQLRACNVLALFVRHLVGGTRKDFVAMEMR